MKYFILARFNEWVVDQTEDKEEAEKWYKNQHTKLDGFGCESVYLVEGKILKHDNRSLFLKSQGYPRKGLE